jgi:8-oxo-dGTP pyrophosphatase MutT (NUDIX family)
MADYNKAGLIVVENKKLLLCRKDNTTSKLILPGGCIEEGESALECLARELREELGEVEATNLHYIGTYRDRAAADDPAQRKTLEIQLYQGDLRGAPVASSEIVELVWAGEEDSWERQTPIMINQILPDLINRGILPWSTNR